MAIIRYRNADGTIKEVVCLKGDKGDKGDAGGTAAETTVENGNDIRIPHGGGQSAPLGDNVQNALENLADAFNGTYIYTDTKTEDAMQFSRNTFCNALKGKAEGELVTLRDVSPVRHNVGVEVSGKNLANKAAFVEYPSVRKYLDVYLPAGNYYYSSNMHAASGAVFYTGIVPDGEIINNNNIQLFSNFNGTVDEGAFTIAESGTYRFLIYCSDANIKAALDGAWGNVWIQIERGVKATPYTPYIEDTSAVKVQVLGKNLMPFPYKDGNKVYNGITWTVNDDGTVTANGTASGDSFFLLAEPPHYTNTNGIPWCVVSGCPSGGSADTYHILSVMTGHRETGSGIGVEVAPSYFRFRIIIKSGYTADNLVFSPQVEAMQKGVVVKTPYEPYKAPVEYAQGEAVKSVHPSMNIMTDTAGAMVDVEYNRDINKAVETLMQMVATTGGSV